MAFDLRPVLEADFPSLAVDSVEELGEGWDHIAYLVNRDLVFRLPWAIVEGDDDRVVPATSEIALLRALAGQLSVAVPDVVLVAPGDRYFGYRFVPGRSVQDLLEEGDPAPAPLVATVVRVAIEVETLLTVDDARAMGVHVRDTRGERTLALRALREAPITDAMRSVGELAVERFGERWSAAASRRLVTMHADFGMDHWLVDEHDEIVALIDWSDTCVAPPENHFSPLMWHVPTLVADAINAYEQATSDSLDRQLVFANGYENALSDLLELIEEDPIGNADGIAWCQHFLTRWSDPDLMATLGVSEGHGVDSEP